MSGKKAAQLIKDIKNTPGRNHDPALSGIKVSDDMANRLAAREKQTPDPLQLSPLGATIIGNLNSEQWFELLNRVQTIKRAYLWILADILRYGLKREYGETEAEVQRISDITGLSIKRLDNLASLAHTFEISRRRENLSIRHYFEVQTLPEKQQEDWLNKAQENNWSARELHRQITGKTLPATVSILADKHNRNRINKIWRAVQSGDYKKVKRDDIRLAIAWLKKVEDEL